MEKAQIKFRDWINEDQALINDTEFLCFRLMEAGIDPMQALPLMEARKRSLLPPYGPEPVVRERKPRKVDPYVPGTPEELDQEIHGHLDRWTAKHKGNEGKAVRSMLTHMARIARGSTPTARKYQAYLRHKGVMLKPEGGWEWGEPPHRTEPTKAAQWGDTKPYTVSRRELDDFSDKQADPKAPSIDRTDYMADPEIQQYFIRNKLMNADEIKRVAAHRAAVLGKKNVPINIPEPQGPVNPAFDPSKLPPVQISKEEEPETTSDRLRRGFRSFRSFLGDKSRALGQGAMNVGRNIGRAAAATAVSHIPTFSDL